MSGSETEKTIERKSSICGCLVGCSSQEFSRWLNHPEVDLVEWRIDLFANRYSMEEMKSFFSTLSIKNRLPVIATNRPIREMGAFSGREDFRLSMLEEAAKCGAEWIDLEHDADLDRISGLRQAGAKVLLSWHDPVETPPREVLHAKLNLMRKTGADALKMVTLAKSSEDNLRVAELIPLAREEFGIGLIAFCMGEAGKWSRLANIFLGSPWTYAQFDEQSATAPGQLTVSELRMLIHFFGQH